jgi:hypothetical protein
MTAALESIFLDSGFIAAQAAISAIVICSSEPTDYASANAALLGSNNFGAGAAFSGPSALTAPTGRQIVSNPVTAGTITTSGYGLVVGGYRHRIIVCARSTECRASGDERQHVYSRELRRRTGESVMLGRPELKILSQEREIEREIDRAWLQHEPIRDRIPSVAWRQLRGLKKQFEPTAVKVTAALKDEEMLRLLVTQCCQRRGMARQRLLTSIRRTFPGAEVKVVHKDVLEISWLAPSPPVIAAPRDHGERQNCTLCCYAVAWPQPPFKILQVRSAWSLEVPDHAAGRYLQRAGETADFKSALFSAANHFYAADMSAVVPHIGKGTDIYLPAGEGVFVGTVIGARSGEHGFLYARAATWIAQAWLRADQTPLPQAKSEKESVAALLLE